MMLKSPAFSIGDNLVQQVRVIVALFMNIQARTNDLEVKFRTFCRSHMIFVLFIGIRLFISILTSDNLPSEYGVLNVHRNTNFNCLFDFFGLECR